MANFGTPRNVTVGQAMRQLKAERPVTGYALENADTIANIAAAIAGAVGPKVIRPVGRPMLGESLRYPGIKPPPPVPDPSEAIVPIQGRGNLAEAMKVYNEITDPQVGITPASQVEAFEPPVAKAVKPPKVMKRGSVPPVRVPDAEVVIPTAEAFEPPMAKAVSPPMEPEIIPYGVTNNQPSQDLLNFPKPLTMGGSSVGGRPAPMIEPLPIAPQKPAAIPTAEIAPSVAKTAIDVAGPKSPSWMKKMAAAGAVPAVGIGGIGAMIGLSRLFGNNGQQQQPVVPVPVQPQRKASRAQMESRGFIPASRRVVPLSEPSYP